MNFRPTRKKLVKAECNEDNEDKNPEACERFVNQLNEARNTPDGE
jgi:hypothetical protein